MKKGEKYSLFKSNETCHSESRAHYPEGDGATGGLPLDPLWL